MSEEKIVPYFSERLKRIREACGLTQDTLSLATGIDRSTLAYYESGRVFPSLNRLCLLSSLLCIPLDVLTGAVSRNNFLFKDEGLENNPFGFDTPQLEDIMPSNLGALDSEEQLLILYFRQLEKQEKQEFLGDLSETVEHIQRERYGLDSDTDVIISPDAFFNDNLE